MSLQGINKEDLFQPKTEVVSTIQNTNPKEDSYYINVLLLWVQLSIIKKKKGMMFRCNKKDNIIKIDTDYRKQVKCGMKIIKLSKHIME